MYDDQYSENDGIKLTSELFVCTIDDSVYVWYIINRIGFLHWL